MIRIVFDQAATNAAERKIQHSIVNLVKRRLEQQLECDCLTSHAVIQVGGNWRTGDFRVTDVTSCCLGSLDKANDLLGALHERSGTFSSFTRSALNSRDKARNMFTLR